MPRGEVNLDPISTASAGRLRRCGGRIRRHLDRQKRCRIPTRTEAWIAAPEENHVCVQSMPTRHRRDRGTWLQCFSHNTPLERLRVVPPPPFSSVCQNKCPRKISGHDCPQSRQDSHTDHKSIKVGKAGRLRYLNENFRSSRWESSTLKTSQSQSEPRLHSRSMRFAVRGLACDGAPGASKGAGRRQTQTV